MNLICFPYRLSCVYCLLIKLFLEELDLDDLRRQQEAIRSFTESVEMDFPPPPELPSALDIDSYEESYAGRMKESSTIDTIIEVSTFYIIL